MSLSRYAGAATAAALLSLVACNGGGGTPTALGTSAVPAVVNGATPVASASGAPVPGASATPTAKPSTTATSVPGSNGIGSGSAADFGCNAAVVPIGSTAFLFSVPGNISGASFSAATDPAANRWSKSPVVLDVSPTVSPEPTFSPAPGVTPSSTTPAYVYSGTYTLKNANGSVDASGCAIVETTANGTPISSIGGNAAVIGAPVIPDNAQYGGTLVASGRFSAFQLGNLSSSGGSGSFTLDNSQTGTISLNKRTSFDLPVYTNIDSLQRQATGLIRGR